MKNIACLLVFLACSLSCSKTGDDPTLRDQNQVDQTNGTDSGDNSNQTEVPDNSDGNQDNADANLDDITSGFESLIIFFLKKSHY